MTPSPPEPLRPADPHASPVPGPRRLGWPWALGLLAALGALYARGLGGGFVNDDRTLFVDTDLLPNMGLRDVWRVFTPASNYWGDVQPVRDLLWMAEYALFGQRTAGWHVVSVLLYAATCVVAFRFLREVYRGTAPAPLLGVDGADVSAALAVALFAAHPVHVEVVAYVFGQRDLLFVAFSLAALGALRRGLDDPARRTRDVAAGIAFAWLALFCKSIAIVLVAAAPVLWLAADPARRPRPGRALAVWAAASLPALPWMIYLNREIQRLFHANYALSWTPPLERLPLALKVLGAHTRLAVWPAGLNFGYPFDGSPSLDANLVAGAVTLAALAALAVRFRRDAAVVLGAAIYLLFLVPVLQLHGTLANESIYDRYLSVSVLGLAMLAERGLRATGARRAVQAAIVAALAAGGAAATVAYVPAFADEVAVARAGYERFPGWPRAAFDYAYDLTEAGRLDEASALVAREPSLSRPPWLRAYFEGWIALERGDAEGAIPVLAQAWIDAVASGWYPFPTVPLARAFVATGRLEQAEGVLRDGLAHPIYQPLEAYHARKLLERVARARAGADAPDTHAP